MVLLLLLLLLIIAVARNVCVFETHHNILFVGNALKLVQHERAVEHCSNRGSRSERTRPMNKDAYLSLIFIRRSFHIVHIW